MDQTIVKNSQKSPFKRLKMSSSIIVDSEPLSSTTQLTSSPSTSQMTSISSTSQMTSISSISQMTSISSVSQSSAPEYYIPPHSHLSSIADCTQAYDRLIKIINKEPLKLVNWGLPEKLLNYYHKKEISQLFEWQLACLDRPGVLTKNRNLVYSAPTSAGKTMVADILMYKTIFEKRRKVLFILPFVSIVMEKVNSLKRVLDMVDKRIETFAGSVEPPNGGVATVDVAVCTIEKANNIVNR